MRFLLVIAAGVLIAQYGVAQEGPPGGGGGRGAGRGAGRGGGRGPVEPPPPPKPGFECFDHAATPDYPRAALQQHIDGDVWVTFDVTAQGTPDKIHTEISTAWAAGKNFLCHRWKRRSAESKFKSPCDGKSVAVVYRYDLIGQPVAAPNVTTKSDARIMYIDSAPELAPAVRSASAKK